MITRRDADSSVWTVGDLLQWTESYFKKLELPSARLDAEILLAKAVRRTRLELYTGYQMLVEPGERALFRSYVERRARFEPIAYITGAREFYSLSFEVSPAVLVPRPETEHLVEAALEVLRGGRGGIAEPAVEEPVPAPRVLDLGTGSGNIAVAIAVNAPDTEVDAVDSSTAALEVARRNAEAHGVSGRVGFHQGDLFAAIPASGGTPASGGRYRLIVSNPPYISRSEYGTLMDDVRLHEPREALLDARSPSGDGLGFYRAIAGGARAHLEARGSILVEVGAAQAGAVAAIFATEGYTHERTVKDYAGIERVVISRLEG